MTEQQRLESPQLEEGQQGEVKPQEGQQQESQLTEEQVEGLVQELDKAGITKPEQVSGMAGNAREFGRLANILGQERQKTADLETRLAQLESSGRQNVQQAENAFDDYDAYDEPSQQDLEGTIRNVMRHEKQLEQQKAMQIQKQQSAAWNAIVNDQDYSLVKDQWETQLKDPQFVYQIQSGELNPVAAYQQLVRSHYKTQMRLAKDTIDQLRGGKPAATPQVESGQVSTGREPTQPAEAEQRLSKYKEDVNKGKQLTQDEEIDIIDQMLK